MNSTAVYRQPSTVLRPPASGARASRGAAFTLIELMVAAAITTLLLLGMTGIFDQSMKAWRLASRRADAEREVRAALSQIQRDLSGLVVGPLNPIYVNVAQTNRVNIPNPFRLNLANSAGPQNANWFAVSQILFFASAQPSRPNQNGDLAGVGYFLAWDTNSNQGSGAWNLYRRYQSPTDLLTGLVARAALPTLNLNSVGPYQINSLPAPEILAANVVNFWVQFVVISNNAPLTIPTNSPAASWITNRPHYAQLELTAFGGEQVRSFSRADWDQSNNITKFGRSFIWRVDL